MNAESRSKFSFLNYVFPPLILVVFGLVATFITFRFIRSRYRTRSLREFRNRSTSFTEAVRNTLKRDFEILDSLRGFLAGQSKVDLKTFHEYVQRVSRGNPEIRGMFWFPKLTRSDYRYLNEEAEIDVLTDLRNHSTSMGDIWPVHDQSGNLTFFRDIQEQTIDVRAYPNLVETAKKSIKNRDPAVTSPVPLEDQNADFGFLVVQYIREPTVLYRKKSKTVKSTEGFVALEINVSKLVQGALEKFDQKDLNLFMFDERIRKNFQQIPLQVEGNEVPEDEFDLTCSIGISSNTNGRNDPEELIERADQALYQAKNRGRNRVIVEEDLSDDGTGS